MAAAPTLSVRNEKTGCPAAAAEAAQDHDSLLADSERANSGSGSDEDEQISVRVRVGDNPEEVVDVDPTADAVQTLRLELGIEGAACRLLPVDLP